MEINLQYFGGRGSSSHRGGTSNSRSGGGLAKLEGSPKQVKWANDIRSSMLKQADFMAHADKHTSAEDEKRKAQIGDKMALHVGDAIATGKMKNPKGWAERSFDNYYKSELARAASKKADGKGYKPVSQFRRREHGSPEAKKAYYKTAHAYDKKLGSLYSELIRKQKSSRWFIDHQREGKL